MCSAVSLGHTFLDKENISDVIFVKKTINSLYSSHVSDYEPEANQN
jgi:hypothetical protein